MTVAAVLLAATLPEASPLQAQEQQQQDQQQATQEGRQRHIVRSGDTLWDLAEFYLTDPFLWPEIYRINTMVIEDPHWIYPDEELLVPGPGEVMVQRPPPDGLPGEGEEVVVRPPEPDDDDIEQIEIPTGRSIFAARELQRGSLTYQRFEPPPPIPVTEYDFNRSGLLIPLEELAPSGEIVATVDPKPTAKISGEFLNVTRFSQIFVSHPGGEPPELADRLMLYRLDRHVKGHGYVLVPTGVGTVVDLNEDVSTVVVTEIYGPIHLGNRATAVEPFEVRPGVFAEPVAAGPAAEVVAFQDEQPVPTVEDIIFIDIGQEQGVEIGDEFEIYTGRTRATTGHRLPPETIARARAVRTTQNTTTLRLIKQRYPAIDTGLPVRLVAKMPS